MATVGPGQSWRLVHDGTSVLSLEETSGYTESQHTIFEAATKAECRAEIARLNLVSLPLQRTGPSELSSLQFMDRFSEATQLAVVAAAKQNDSVKLWYDRMLAADVINLDDPRTIAGLNAMVAANVITADEAEIALS